MATLLLLFLAGVAIDLVGTVYVMSVADRKPLIALFTAMFITASGLAANWVVIAEKDKAGAIAYILGCGIGTYFVVAFAKRKRDQEDTNEQEGEKAN